MLPAGEPPIPKNEVISSSSSTLTTPILNPPPPQARHIDRITNNNIPENQDAIDILETELLCEESFSEIIKEEEEEVVGTSNVSSTNCSVFPLNERKRLHSHSTDDARKNGNQESEQGERGEGGNQESELDDDDDDDKEGGNQENNNGDEDKKENEETEEENTEELDEGEGEEHEHEEYKENVESENNINH
ncbi:hypothetical protein HAX54_030401 [Datura stramonium]|uniref:Uncharacterized protein n=1 Tax=Datura stramonium TaxID=4076 RepID=A0ABS8V7N0_DATST|nr:hypothetical protein [Datura stramonium]